MPTRIQLRKALQLKAVHDGLGNKSRYRVTSRLLLHQRSTTSGSCACCGSPLAKVVDIIPDLDLLIDLDAKWRGCRSQVEDVALWDKHAEIADERIDLPIRVSEVSMPLVLDTKHQIILASGASRSSKTQTGCYWSLRQWMLRGGWSKIGAFVGFEVEQAHILKDKFCIGEGEENPPVCDPRLILSFPPKLRSVDKNIHMLDGTRIRLVHTKGDGGNIAGRSYAWWQWTEAAKTKHGGNYAQLRGRIVSSRGQGYIDAVPEAAHWLKTAVVEPFEEEQEQIRDDIAAGREPPKQTMQVTSLAAVDNPWNDPEQAEALIRDLVRLDPRVADRYARGLWTGDANKTFGEYYDAVRHTFELESWDVAHLGMADVTGAASQRWFYEEHDWLVGVDVNANPHSAVVCKLGVPMEKLGPVRRGALTHKQRQAAMNPDNWVLVCFDFIQVWNKDSEEAARFLATVHDGRFAGAGVVIDASSCYRGHNAGGAANAKKNSTPRISYEDMGFEVEPPDKTTSKDPQRGDLPKSPTRFDSAIVVRRLLRHGQILFNKFRCRKLIKAVRDQDSEPDGITPVRASGTAMDRHIISGTDVLRYVAWPFFKLDERDVPPPLAQST